jgi:hypothetical protein
MRVHECVKCSGTGLYGLVQACTGLYGLVRACTGLYGLVATGSMELCGSLTRVHTADSAAHTL